MVTVPSIKVIVERRGIYGFIKGEQNLRWEALTIGSREVGNDFHHKRSGDNTKTYLRE